MAGRPRPALATALAVGVALGACSHAAATRGSSTARAPTTTAPAALTVAERTETFVDTTRTTPANGRVPEKPSRTLVTAIFYPSNARGPFPLVVFSHGFRSTALLYRHLLTAWAEAGFVVAAPDFPLSSAGADGGPVVTDYVRQPGDVSFVITEMLRLSNSPSSPLRGLVDASRIAAAGHSLGAITTLGVALDTCCRDARIHAAVVLAGIALPFPGGTYFTGIRTPVLFVHGDHDTTAPYAAGHKAFDDASPPKFLVTILGGDHVRPYLAITDTPEASAVERVTIDFLDRYVDGRASALDELRRDASIPGVDHLDQAV